MTDRVEEIREKFDRSGRFLYDDIRFLLSEVQRLRNDRHRLRGLFKWSHDEHHGFFRPGGVDFEVCPEHPCLTARDLLDDSLSNTLELPNTDPVREGK